jgi:TPR repeat protein
MMKKTSIIRIFICSTLLLGACSQSPEEPAARAHSGRSQQKTTPQPQQTSPPTASHQQPQRPRYRTVYRTINGQQMTLVEMDTPLMHLPLAQVKQRAAAKDPEAVYELGRRYMKGEGLAQNPGKAIPLLKQAAAAGNAEAQNDLGLLFFFGHLGFPQNRHKAFELYLRTCK